MQAANRTAVWRGKDGGRRLHAGLSVCRKRGPERAEKDDEHTADRAKKRGVGRVP
jgi:hypothetical protein